MTTKATRSPTIRFAAVIAMLAIAALSIGLAFAFLTDSDHAINNLTVGQTDVQIEEDFEPPASLDPGNSFKKEVSIRNVGTGPAYVRVLVGYSSNALKEALRIDFDDESWTSEDGESYRYYLSALYPNDSTTPLFTKAEIVSTVEDNQQATDIFVYAEAASAIDPKTGKLYETAPEAFNALTKEES